MVKSLIIVDYSYNVKEDIDIKLLKKRETIPLCTYLETIHDHVAPGHCIIYEKSRPSIRLDLRLLVFTSILKMLSNVVKLHTMSVSHLTYLLYITYKYYMNIKHKKYYTCNVCVVFITDVYECQEKGICLNNGTCVDTAGSYYCLCPNGWTGDHCETSGYFISC